MSLNETDFNILILAYNILNSNNLRRMIRNVGHNFVVVSIWLSSYFIKLLTPCIVHHIHSEVAYLIIKDYYLVVLCMHYAYNS